MAKRVFARFRHFASFSNRREPIAIRVLRGFNFGLADSLEKKALRLSERRRKLKGHTRDSNRKRFLIPRSRHLPRETPLAFSAEMVNGSNYPRDGDNAEC